MISDKDVAQPLNNLARHQMKQKLLHDILLDLNICKLEGWNGKEYIEQLKKEIDDIYKAFTGE